MVLAKSKNSVGLGNSLMNDRFGKGKGGDMRKGGEKGIQRTGVTGETYIVNEKKEAAWVKMRSVTQQGDLDEFLSTAELAGTDFTAEKLNNVKIIHKDQKNPFLLSDKEEKEKLKKFKENKNRLTVPRRPDWDEKTTPQQLDERERASMLRWRRGLAELQEDHDLLLTPFERNLEVWRQLWRVIERSDLVVQIVDARNPLMFRSEDLEDYVKEADEKKNNLLLVNKADMMTMEQRQAWADYFDAEKIAFRFFSAELAKERNEAAELEERAYSDSDSASDEEEDSEDDAEEASDEDLPAAAANLKIDSTQKTDWSHERTRILTTDELEALFLEHAPKQSAAEEGSAPRKTQIGLVGYPNVGKSSTINALMGAKKVSVSATPGKTKHFQTLHLSEQIVLCDCPGLVFPNFATTKAELVCNGVLPIDQLREYTGPAGLVAARVPQYFLEAVYGLKLNIRPIEEGGTGTPTSEELLRAYATARGFSVQGFGQPDESRAARAILKDFVKGRLLYCNPPPSNPPIDAKHFNRELYDAAHLPEKRRAALASLAAETEAAESTLEDDSLASLPLPQGSSKSRTIDKGFFGPGSGSNSHVARPFHYKYSEQGTKQLTSKKARTLYAIENNLDEEEVARLAGGKRHADKRNKRAGKKVRSAGYEYVPGS